MGMPTAFSDKADFSGIDPKRGLAISEVVHKAFVDVSEEGTEAAAATGITMRATAMRMPEQAIVFRADHPFIFLIRDRRTGAVLFIGRLMDPR
jgi:serpin B